MTKGKLITLITALVILGMVGIFVFKNNQILADVVTQTPPGASQPQKQSLEIKLTNGETILIYPSSNLGLPPQVVKYSSGNQGGSLKAGTLPSDFYQNLSNYLPTSINPPYGTPAMSQCGKEIAIAVETLNGTASQTQSSLTTQLDNNLKKALDEVDLVIERMRKDPQFSMGNYSEEKVAQELISYLLEGTFKPAGADLLSKTLSKLGVRWNYKNCGTATIEGRSGKSQTLSLDTKLKRTGLGIKLEISLGEVRVTASHTITPAFWPVQSPKDTFSAAGGTSVFIQPKRAQDPQNPNWYLGAGFSHNFEVWGGATANW